MSRDNPERDRDPTDGLDPLLLQAYFDDELSPEETADVERALEASEDDRLRLDALEEMRELTRFDMEQHVEDVDLVGLWGRLEAELEVTSPSNAAPSSAPDEPGWWDSVKEFFDRHKPVLVPAMGFAVLATLVLLPVLMNQAPPERVVEKERTIVVVEPLEFEGNSTGTVSYTSENTPVIWYLGEPGMSAEGTKQPQATQQIDPGALRRDLRLPSFPVKRILQRLERIERIVLPGTRPQPGTPQTPPPANSNDPEGPI